MSSEADARVAVHDLWKTFHFYRRPTDRFLRVLTRGRLGVPTPFHALRGVSFLLARGTSTGIIGVNGAGKSTLLKVLTGTLEPSRGSAVVRGRMASLLELGTGFHPLFTGRQNIFYNARFLGLTDQEIEERLGEIEAFSELGDFLDRPLRVYSTGMQVRLAFSVAASVDPDVLVVDEVLAVGDAYFQQKCIRRIREFRDRGVTILFVSHDPSAIRTLCDRGLLMHEGRIIDEGTPAGVLEHYNALIARKKAESDYFVVEVARNGVRGQRSGSFAALISEVDLLDRAGRPARAVLSGEDVTVRVRVFFFEPIADPTVGVLVRDRLGNDVYGTNTYHHDVTTGRWEAGRALEVRFRMTLHLGAGEYTITAAVHSLGVHVFDSYDWFDGGLVFRILPSDTRSSIGVARLPTTVEVASADAPDPAAVLARALGDVPSDVRMAADDARFLRAGWHAREGTGAEAYRWAEREAIVLLSIVGRRLCFEAAADRPPGAPPVELRVMSVGRELGRIQIRPASEWQELTLELPPDVPCGPSHLHLIASDAWRPAATGHNADQRELGVRFRRIWST